MEGLSIFLVIIGFLIWVIVWYNKNQSWISPDQSNKLNDNKMYRNQRASTFRDESIDEILSNLKITVEVNDSQTKRSKDNFQWYPKGMSMNVHDYDLTDIYVYVGTQLTTGSNLEPSLINPELSINEKSPDYNGESMHYWPEYSSCTPEARAAYLSYCSNSFRDEKMPKGYVFLYYYGLERRLLSDDISKEERGLIINEIHRLRDIHSSNRSFNGYSSMLLKYVNADVNRSDKVTRDDLHTYEHFTSLSESDLTTYDKLQLGYYFILGVEIPSNLLFKIGLNDLNSLGMAGRRCFKELNKLFNKRLPRKYIDVNEWTDNGKKIKYNYSPASSALRGDRFTRKTDIPDLVKSNSLLVEELTNLIIKCENDLENYSRLLAINKNKNSLQALARLPSELINANSHPRITNLIKKLDQELHESEFTLLDANILTDIWDIEGVNKFRKKNAIEVAQVFHHLGYGIEPDIRFGYHNIDKQGKITVFKIDKENTPKKPTKEYKLVLPIIHMTALVGLADGIFKPEEERHFEEFIETLMHLSDAEKKRINGYLYWLTSADVNVSSLKNKIEKLNNARKTKIIEYLISLAWADHHIHPDEISMLQKLGEIFGIEESKVLKKLYNLQHRVEDELVQVKRKFDLRGQKVPEAKHSPRLLNEELLQARIDQTNEVQNILSDVFEEEDDEDKLSTEPNKLEDDFTSYLGLDKQHSELVGTLISKEIWTQGEFNKLCNDIGLMPNGAIEIINEKSFDKHEDDLLLIYDEIEINEYISNKL